MNAPTPSPAPIATPDEAARMRKFIRTGLGLLLLFSIPLVKVVLFALHSELYSFIVIVPFISAYLVWIDREKLYPSGQPAPRWLAAILLTVGGTFLLWAGLMLTLSDHHVRADLLALCMYALVFLLGGAACLHLGRQALRVLAFPLGFLIFLAPLPLAVETGLETMLQHGSSWTAHRFFELSGMPTFRDGTIFQLPGFSMQVAPECSGIRSTLALFLTSLVAGQLFLRSPWKRALLAAVVLPIALVRNGFRVFVIGELCVQIGPHMINSWIHRHGGPVFFALSLIPFGLILIWLYKSDSRPSASR
jgi:exosortase C (VPDSG-CTERM-specific)